MKYLSKLIFILVVILILVTLFLLLSPLFLSKNKEDFNKTDYYSYTKAICDSNNFCEDYEITCENNELVSLKPLFNAGLQFSNIWKDPRDLNSDENLCLE
jgi:competence protein ComGC